MIFLFQNMKSMTKVTKHYQSCWKKRSGNFCILLVTKHTNLKYKPMTEWHKLFHVGLFKEKIVHKCINCYGLISLYRSRIYSSNEKRKGSRKIIVNLRMIFCCMMSSTLQMPSPSVPQAPASSLYHLRPHPSSHGALPTISRSYCVCVSVCAYVCEYACLCACICLRAYLRARSCVCLCEHVCCTHVSTPPLSLNVTN